MHIPEGILSGPALAAGAVGAAAGVAIGIKRMRQEDLPRVAVLASTFFVASLVHVPIGPASAHLILNGLAGVVLGWAAFPALLVGLFLQAIFFGFGGLTALGANAFNMALPAVVCYYAFGRPARRARRPATAFAWGAAAGVVGVLGAGLMLGLTLWASGQEFAGVAKLVLLAHLPVIAVEGFVSGSAVALLRQVRPEVLAAPALEAAREG
jgi:cobalt/nickel transport system permease protein